MDQRPHEAECPVMFPFKNKTFIYLIPITMYQMVGWKKDGQYGPVSQSEAGNGFKIRVVWVRIPPGLPRVDVCTIVSVSTKSKIVGFAGSARKPVNEVIKCLFFLG